MAGFDASALFSGALSTGLAAGFLVAGLAGVIMRRHRNWEDCVTLRAQRIRIESDAQVPYQIDGDIGGYLPVDIEVLPQRLTLLVPEDWLGGKQ